MTVLFKVVKTVVTDNAIAMKINSISIGAWFVNFMKMGMNIYIICMGLRTSLWPSDGIWRHGPGSLLAHAIACCLTAPGQYLNQC